MKQLPSSLPRLKNHKTWRNKGHKLMVKFDNDEVSLEEVLACFRYSTGRLSKSSIKTAEKG